ncbi:hypothetical protein KFU94_50795 [Chloroflexi bacterium TSY]|nr:hypothetical protein [Chloroflexi bacterium TSY]
MRFRRIDGHGWKPTPRRRSLSLWVTSKLASPTNWASSLGLGRVIDTNSNEMRYLYLHDGGYLYPQSSL